MLRDARLRPRGNQRLDRDGMIRTIHDVNGKDAWQRLKPFVDRMQFDSSRKCQTPDLLILDADRAGRIAIQVGNYRAKWLVDVFKSTLTPRSGRLRIHRAQNWLARVRFIEDQLAAS